VLAVAMCAALVGCGRQPDPSPQAPGPVEQPVPATEQVDRVMTVWRTGILNRDPDSVDSCDQIFRGRPATFTPALVASAKNDADDRVRAFSARVLGKLRDPALLPVFRELLADRNQFVRGNAAWAMGQLPGPETITELQRLQRVDPTPHVQKAAAQALHSATAGREANRR
jgi:hypothetical protein